MEEKEIEQKIIEAVAKRTRELTNRKTAIEKELADLKNQRDKVYADWSEATKSLKEQLSKMNQPFQEKVNIIDKSIQDKDHRKWETGCKLSLVNEEIRAKFVDESSTFTTAEAFRGWMRKQNIELHDVQMVKKKLSNGITLFRHFSGYDGRSTEARNVSYFAIKGKLIVGFHHTEKAQHRGDDTYRSGWINVKKLESNNSQEIEKSDPLFNEEYRHHYYSHGIKLKHWIERLEKQQRFTGLDITDKDNIEALERH